MPDPITSTGNSVTGHLTSQSTNVSQMHAANASSEAGSEVVFRSNNQANPNVKADPAGQEQAASGLPIVEKNPRVPERNINVEDAAKTLKEYLKNLPSDLQFRKDEETGTVVFKVVNPVTKEVIREFPPKEIVEMSKRLRHLSEQSEKSGILLDTQT